MRKKQIFRTGLAVMLTGLFFVTGSAASFAQAKQQKPESDSAILFHHIREMKIENAVEEFSEHSFNSHLTDVQLDSMLQVNGMSVTGGRIFYSPDSAFKIFVVYGESCGAYCNPYNKAWLHFNDGSQMILSGVDFDGSSMAIEMLPDGRYLIINGFYARPAGYYTITGHTAYVISFTDHKIITHPAFISMDTDVDSDSTYYSQTQEFVIDSAEYLTYDPSSKQLQYQYGHDPAITNEEGNAYVRTGYFQFENGKFVEQEHTLTRYKVRHE